MNTPVRRVALAVMALMALLLANMTYIQVVMADELRNDPNNKRTLYEEAGRQRGQIIVDGSPLALSTPSNDRWKFQRSYPKGAPFATVTGYFGITLGSTDLEYAGNDVLSGSAPSLIGARLSDLITGRDPRGGALDLTIKAKVQQAAYDGLAAKGLKGSVVAIDPNNGEILAMVSTPSFDPNALASHDLKSAGNRYQELIDDTKNKPLLNRAIRETYPPGSTFKLVVAAAALKDGKDKDTPVTTAPSVNYPGSNTPLFNFGNTACGTGKLIDALASSCNTAFAELADQVGKDKLREQAKAFGIGEQDWEIPMKPVASTLGDISDRGALYRAGIGQADVRLTPLQNAVIAATIANDGQRMAPHLIKRTLDPDLSSEVDATGSKRVKSAMSSSDVAKLKEMMIASEQHSGGQQIQGVTVASKTGTAEHGEHPRETPPHGWYVAFAPAEKPTVAIAVIVEDGGDRGLNATGASIARPIGLATMRAALGR
ncbi:penicillin-binding protein 2 [Pseudonocardiaceae bacterium YIM PH 21723]|nr:penicillin-binding protein 2 [Pseudonocardiaceae bacterium YIM PH 21723]